MKRRYTKLAKEERQAVFYRIPKALDAQIERIAKERRESMNLVAIELLTAGLERYTSNEAR
jgi:hypothetical protein